DVLELRIREGGDEFQRSAGRERRGSTGSRRFDAKRAATTVAPPPGPYRTVDQSAGTVPKNSLPAVGVSISSPSEVCAIATPASAVPALKSATVVSVIGICVAGIVKLAGGDVDALPAASVDVTV